MPRELSDAELEMMNAQQGIFNDDDVSVDDPNEMNTGLDETAQEADILMENVEASAQEAKDNHPDIESKEEHWAEIDKTVDEVRDEHRNLQKNIELTKKSIKELQNDLKDLQKKQRLEQLAKYTMNARDKFVAFGEACVAGFKKIAELGKEATQSLQAAVTAASRTEIANNFNAGFRGIMNEISQVRLQAHENAKTEIDNQMKAAKKEHGKELAQINKQVAEKAKKQLNSPLHRIALGFSAEGRERLKNPELDLQKQIEKVKQEPGFKRDYKNLETKYYGDGLAKGILVKLQKEYDKENKIVNKAHERTARFMDKVNEKREEKSFGELYKDAKQEIVSKTYESKKTGEQVRENDLKDKDKVNGNKTVEKKQTKEEVR